METSKDPDSVCPCLSCLIPGWVFLLPYPPMTLLPSFSHLLFLIFFLLFSPFFLFPSVPPSFSAWCNSTYLYRSFGDPSFSVAVYCRHNAERGRGSPSLSSASPCWGGAYYCFPSSSYSRTHICASGFGHGGANHQCSQRPAWYPHGSPPSGTGYRWSNPPKVNEMRIFPNFKNLGTHAWSFFNHHHTFYW